MALLALATVWGHSPDARAENLITGGSSFEAGLDSCALGTLAGRAKDVGVTCEFHPLEGEGHAAWTPMDRHIRWIAPFLYRHMIETP
ncbi:MAG: hypothetical protein NTW86_10430 [Candidatus Sumerlaeota bacterium]|nr:hypothetical protein [Candidatus Sumerlaeota bacterium]